jgi:hypothetical protein
MYEHFLKYFYLISDLKEMSCSALNEVLTEYEIVIKELSEILIRELALRDELEYDKELKKLQITCNDQSHCQDENFLMDPIVQYCGYSTFYCCFCLPKFCSYITMIYLWHM